MKTDFDEQSTAETPQWLLNLLPFISIILGSGALWYAWLRYNSILNRPDYQWLSWIQPALIALMGLLCLSAAVLFIAGKPSGWSVFKVGVSIVPLVLFSNLVILVFRVIQNIIQGNASPFFDRLLTQPYKILLIPIVIIALVLLGSLGKREKDNINT